MLRPERSRFGQRVEAVVQEHQFTYSLMQLRLVGLLLLLFLLSRVLIVALLSVSEMPLQMLSALTALSSWLPLLPLGTSLYLLGGGRQRLRSEFLPTELLHRSLVPLALVCLLLLPALTLQDVVRLGGNQRQALAREGELLSSHRIWRQQAAQSASSNEVRTLAERNRVQLPGMPGEPVELTRWRLDRALELEHEALRQSLPALRFSPYERELLSAPRTASSILLQLITGAGLLLLHRQGNREIQRHGLSTGMFFRADPVRRQQQIC